MGKKLWIVNYSIDNLYGYYQCTAVIRAEDKDMVRIIMEREINKKLTKGVHIVEKSIVIKPASEENEGSTAL